MGFPLGRTARSRARQKGITLLDTLVALALVATVGLAIIAGLATTMKGSLVADERSTAESLARSGMEWAKLITYVPGATSYPPAPVPGSGDYDGYSVSIAAQPLSTPDGGVQKISITVSRADRQIMMLEGYKVNR